MKTSRKHPDRRELLEAIASGLNPFKSHFRRCEGCRLYFELLSKFRLSGIDLLDRTSSGGLKDLESIAVLQHPRPGDAVVRGVIAFDSWSDQSAVAWRDSSGSVVRRLKLHATSTTLELVAERQSGVWNFVARLYQDEQASSEFIIKVGRKRVAPRTLGYYHWTSKNPPRRLLLQSETAQIEFDSIPW